MLFIGDDWAEAHHDIEIEDEAGRVLARKRLPEGLAGITTACTSWSRSIWIRQAEPDQVLVGIETDRGPWVQALLAPAIWCMRSTRCRWRGIGNGIPRRGRSRMPRDAHLLAEIVRLDRAHHRRIAGDSEIAEHVKIAARAHQTMIWSRVRQVNTLRSLLREYYPAALAAFGTDLASRDALAVLTAAPSPELGRRLSQARIETLLRACRPATQRRRDRRQDPDRAGLRAAGRPTRCDRAYAASASALLAVLTAMVTQTEVLAGQVEQGFGQHPDAEIYRSQPGLGVILGARVLAEFGDDPDRYADAKARKNYSGMSPITKASGTKRVVLARFARNRRLGDALFLQAFARFEPPPAPAPSTTGSAPAAPPTTKPSAPSRTGSSASSTAASNPHPLRRAPRLAHPRRQAHHRRLTASPRTASISGPASSDGASPGGILHD